MSSSPESHDATGGQTPPARPESPVHAPGEHTDAPARCCPTRSMSTATTRCVETGSGRGEVVGRRCRRSFGGDLEGRPRWGDAFVVEPLDELEECLNGEHLGERVVFDVDRDDDAPQSGVHSAVISVTAARAEDSSTMAFFAA